jgi:hypothetical protein
MAPLRLSAGEIADMAEQAADRRAHNVHDAQRTQIRRVHRGKFPGVRCGFSLSRRIR